jgi:AcrR family transcriptional regulator
MQRTRTALLAAGFELLVDRPIDAIAIDEVVSRAGVAKGSFFNHFADKQAFGAAVAAEVRTQLEARVATANAEVEDPVARIAGGMCVAAQFALEHPRRTRILLRSQDPPTSPAHPLNRGLREDIEAALSQNHLRSEARNAGLLYWLGLCQVLMANLVETRPTGKQATMLLRKMLMLGLSGLGVSPEHAAALISRSTSGLFVK